MCEIVLLYFSLPGLHKQVAEEEKHDNTHQKYKALKWGVSIDLSRRLSHPISIAIKRRPFPAALRVTSQY